MNCQQVTELKSAYLCGELEGGDLRDLEAHLLRCHDCADMVAEERDVDECIRAAMLRQPPDTKALQGRVLGAIRREKRRNVLIAGALIAAMLLLSVLSRSLWSTWRDSRLCEDAVRDHIAEIVRQGPRHWRFVGSEMESLAMRQGIQPSLLEALGSGKYRLDRAKLCRLDGRVFLHLVYRSNQDLVSVYLENSNEFGVAPHVANVSSGHQVTQSQRRGEYVASLSVKGITAIVVSNTSEQAAMSVASLAANAI